MKRIIILACCICMLSTIGGAVGVNHVHYFAASDAYDESWNITCHMHERHILRAYQCICGWVNWQSVRVTIAAEDHHWGMCRHLYKNREMVWQWECEVCHYVRALPSTSYRLVRPECIE